MENLRKLTDKISSYAQIQLKKKTGEQLHQFLEESGEKFIVENDQLSGTVSELLGKGYAVVVEAPSQESSEFSSSSFLDVEDGSLTESFGKGYTLGVEVPSAIEETSAVERLRKFHLHSPRRLVVSPLKDYKPKKIIKRRKAKRWSEVEETTLRKAVNLHGTGNWTFILDSYSYSFPERTAGDLKDKWRNICIKDNKATKC